MACCLPIERATTTHFCKGTTISTSSGENENTADAESPETQTVAGKDRIAELAERKSAGRLGGGEARIEAQHKKGKLTARERIDALLDPGSFNEIDPFVRHQSTDFGLDKMLFDGDSVVTGYGNIDGRQIFVYAMDFTVIGGTLSEVAAGKIGKVMDHAVRVGAPVIGINDSGGARIHEGVGSLAGYGQLFRRNVMASGVVPQITIIAGPSAGGAVYSPALTDFIFMVEEMGQMYLTGPGPVKAATGEDVTFEELGGASMHGSRSGVAQFTGPDEATVLADVRRLLSFLPSNNAEDPPRVATSDDPGRISEQLASVIPPESNQPYDINDVIYAIVDDGDFMPVHHAFAPNIVVGFARMDGGSVGIVANQPNYLAGVLDIDASDKAARFVRLCDAFNIPIVTLVDVPGFMPGTQQEHGGVIRHGAKLLYAYVEATVPKISIITRKAYGGAYIVMASKELRTDVNLAWPTAEIAVLGPEGAVDIIHRRAIADADDSAASRTEMIDEYRDKLANPYIAAEHGWLDDVIDPVQTRPEIIKALRMLATKTDHNPTRKHGNIPL